MNNQLPKPPTDRGAPMSWGYRPRYIERERRAGYVQLDIPVYRITLQGPYLRQIPVTTYTLVLN